MVMSSYSYLAIAVTLGLSLTSGVADDQVCSLDRYGTVTMFNGETANVTLPCKYRLADITCGNHRVKVMPGSAVDSKNHHALSPSTLWVSIVNTETQSSLDIRTSLTNMKKYKAGKINNPWRVKEGSVDEVDSAGYDSSKAAAVVQKNGVFSVEFSNTQGSVVVRCLHDQFSSQGLPETLCGDGTMPNALDSVTSSLFPGRQAVSAKAVMDFIVLYDDTVVQSKTCKGMASKFQGCEDKQDAAVQCQNVFGQTAQAQCLARSERPPEDYYNDCLSSVCDGDASALDTMNDFIVNNCDGGNSCDSNSDCVLPNTLCIGDECLCTPGWFYSVSKGYCVETCQRFSEGSVRYHSVTRDCGDGNNIMTLGVNTFEEEKACVHECHRVRQCTYTAVIATGEPFLKYICRLCRSEPDGPKFNLTGGPDNTFWQRKCV